MKIRSSWFLAFFLALIASIFTIASALAQEEQPQTPSDDQVNAIAKKLYCPVCPNTPLDVCETKACQDWRAQIRQELTSGWSEQQIIDYFVQQYGERVLAEPRRSGFTSMVWVLPVIGVLFGVVVVFQTVQSWKRGSVAIKSQPVSQPPPTVSAESLNQVEKELRDLD